MTVSVKCHWWWRGQEGSKTDSVLVLVGLVTNRVFGGLSAGAERGIGVFGDLLVGFLGRAREGFAGLVRDVVDGIPCVVGQQPPRGQKGRREGAMCQEKEEAEENLLDGIHCGEDLKKAWAYVIEALI